MSTKTAVPGFAPVLAALALGLAACSSETTTTVLRPGVPAAGSDTCGAAPLQGYLGQPVANLPKALMGPSLRVIRPGQGVTMDYSPTRTNVQVDRSGRIIAIACG